MQKELIIMNTIKKVAKQHGVSVKEVRRDFEEMIKVGMSSTEPEAVMF
jgi:ribosome recycling factor